MQEVIEHLKQDDRFYAIHHEIDSRSVEFKCKSKQYSIQQTDEFYYLKWGELIVHTSAQVEDLTDFVLI